MEEYNQFGGSEGNRTLYLLNANQALSQVSYRPMLPNSINYISNFIVANQVFYTFLIVIEA